MQLYNGQKPEGLNQLSIGTSERWGIHSKRAVVDKKHILIGTYNVDPRSANLNSEALIICRDNPELAAHMIKSIQSRIDRSWPLFDNSSPITNLTKYSNLSQKTMFLLALPLANLFDVLL
jgi:putative cardiolipin synthase